MTDKPRKRPPCHNPAPPAPLVQVLPDQRARIDPSVVPQLTCYLLAIRERYENQSRETLSGKTGRSRQMAQGRIAYAQCMCEAIDALTRTFYEVIDLRAYDRARDEWEAQLRVLGGEG